jgi:PD-(D/E)XK nuclease superfamily protein
MNEQAMKMKHPKRRGEWAELRFMAAAAENGLHVTKPWGDSAQYDFIVEHEARFVRVQVKSTGFKSHGGYPCAVHGSHSRYLGDPFDFLAVYVVPEDLWYIIPWHVFDGQASVELRPSMETSKYGKYLGAWDLLKKDSECASARSHEEGAASCK